MCLIQAISIDFIYFRTSNIISVSLGIDSPAIPAVIALPVEHTATGLIKVSRQTVLATHSLEQSIKIEYVWPVTGSSTVICRPFELMTAFAIPEQRTLRCFFRARYPHI